MCRVEPVMSGSAAFFAGQLFISKIGTIVQICEIVLVTLRLSPNLDAVHLFDAESGKRLE